MRGILLITAVIALFALAVGGVSAHDGDQNDGRLDEMMGQMEEMMAGSGSMNDGDHGNSMNTEMDSQTGEEHNEQSDHAGMGCC